MTTAAAMVLPAIEAVTTASALLPSVIHARTTAVALVLPGIHAVVTVAGLVLRAIHAVVTMAAPGLPAIHAMTTSPYSTREDGGPAHPLHSDPRILAGAEQADLGRVRVDLQPPRDLRHGWPLKPMEPPKPDLPKPLERWPSALRVGVAMGPELVATGWASVGLSASFGARFHAVSLDFEAHGNPSLGSLSYPHLGTVSFARVSGVLALCGHVGWVVACGLADAGRFLFPDHEPPLPASYFYGAAGVRLGLELPIVPPRLFLRSALDLRAPIHQARFTEGTTTLFESAAPGVGVGFGLLLELPP